MKQHSRSMGWLVAMAVPFLVLAGCGPSSGPGEDPGADPTALSATTPPILSHPATPPKGPTDQIKPRTVRGTVVQGTQQGCLELVSPPARWVLLGEAAQGLRAGDTVEVVGRPAPQLSSSCNGVPLQVRQVRTL